MANEFKIKKGLIVTGASGGTVVDIQGSQGQLFSVTDDLSGSIFAVSDISGVPILDVNSSGLSTFDGSVGIGLTSTTANLEVKSIQDSSFDEGIGVVRSNTSQTGYINMVGGAMNINAPNAIPIKFRDGGNTNLTIGGDGHATFAGNVTSELNITAGSYSRVAQTTVSILSDAQQNSVLKFREDNDNYGFTLGYYGSPNNFVLTRHDNSATGDTVMSIPRNSSAVTFSTQAFATTATSSGDVSSTLTTKGYVDSLITGATIYRGAWNPSGGGYGSPDLSTVTQTSGYYYICSAAGTAEPNGTGCEPDSWETGDWVIWNDDIVDCAGTGTGGWQKIDNSSVLSGVGTGQTVALWEGAGSVTDSETLGNAPITVSGNNSTFAGNVSLTGGSLSISGDGSNAVTFTETGAGKMTVSAADDIILDAGSDIVLDAGGDDLRLKVSGTEYAKFNNSSSNLNIFSSIQDKSIKFIGNDNGTEITALTLNMADGGDANFLGTVTSPTFLGDLNGTINTATTGVTQTAGNNSTLIATTAYADAAAGAVPIGNYLPLSAGASFPLTDTLYVQENGNKNNGTISMGFGGSGTSKWSFLTGTHYNQATGSGNGTGSAGMAIIGSLSTETYNKVYIGGGPYEINAATQIDFWTNSSTLSTAGGTQKGYVDSGGNWFLGNTLWVDAADDYVGIGTTTPGAKLDVQPTATNRKVTRIANDVMSTYFYNTQADAVLAWTCGSYYQAEVVITANQTNGGTTANLYIRGIWSNNHTSHHWDELEHIGSLPGSTITMSVGQNGSTTNSGRLELDFNYGSGSFSQLNVRVTDFYGSHSYTIT